MGQKLHLFVIATSFIMFGKCLADTHYGKFAAGGYIDSLSNPLIE